MKTRRKNNPELRHTIELLKQKSHENQAKIWKDIARRLDRTSRNWPDINVSSLERHLEKDQMVIVPGKLLGSGDVTKAFTVAAFRFSEKAKEKIRNAGGTCLSIEELIEKNPKGTDVRIME